MLLLEDTTLATESFDGEELGLVLAGTVTTDTTDLVRRQILQNF